MEWICVEYFGGTARPPYFGAVPPIFTGLPFWNPYLMSHVNIIAFKYKRPIAALHLCSNVLFTGQIVAIYKLKPFLVELNLRVIFDSRNYRRPMDLESLGATKLKEWCKKSSSVKMQCRQHAKRIHRDC